MKTLTPLEQAALKEIYNQHPSERPFLEKQIAVATITGRENTGAGFFTHFAVDPRTVSPVPGANRVLETLA